MMNGQLSILVIDDELPIRRALRNALKISRTRSQQLLAMHEEIVGKARARIKGGNGT